MMKKIQTLVLIGLCTLITPNVFASDGVIEINQTCATQLGCFSGDAAGFPVTINGSAGSSYRLTSDLTINVLNTNVITVEAFNINIDLNGFTISCLVSNASCENQGGTGTGIFSNTYQFQYLSVKNGKISHMEKNGLSLPRGSRVSGVEVYNNGEVGIQVGGSSFVTNSISRENGSNGILAQGLIGFAQGVLISNNIVNFNNGSGIIVGEGSTIVSNIVRGNNSTGIFADSGSSIKNNTITINQGMGLYLNTANIVYMQNTLKGNLLSVFGGVNMGQNFCNTAVCP